LCMTFVKGCEEGRGNTLKTERARGRMTEIRRRKNQRAGSKFTRLQSGGPMCVIFTMTYFPGMLS